MPSIDLNSDLGESFGAWSMGDDSAMLEVVTSANIACGFHAGDPAGIRRTLIAAAERGVAVGAHVAYPDLVGFGRRSMSIPTEQLMADVIYQIAALQGLARSVGTRVSYVKPHGALYNTIATDPVQAGAVILALLKLDPQLKLVCLANSPLLDWAREAGLNCIAEAFADRAYTAEGMLVSRSHPGAVLHDAELIAQRMLRLVQEGVIECEDGQPIRLQADSICVHGDSPDALNIARQVKARLRQAGIALRTFA